MFFVFLFSVFGCDLDSKGNSLDVDNDGDGFSEFEGDCDDSNPYTYPGAAELESVDDCMKDEDEDGYGDIHISGFPNDDGLSGMDCDDSNPESTTTDIDFDCDGILTEEDCDDNLDNDDDCDGVKTTEDCDDSNAGLLSQSEDNDCDGITADLDCDDTNTDIGLPSTFYQDSDGDGYGDSEVIEVACEASVGFVSDDTDCDDTNADVNDITNDSDCDGILDE